MLLSYRWTFRSASQIINYRGLFESTMISVPAKSKPK